MTEREMALCDLAFARGMQAAKVMLAQGADERVRGCIERYMLEAVRVLRAPA
jgi:hypothetical protein